jgi:hypothetical protein
MFRIRKSAPVAAVLLAAGLVGSGPGSAATNPIIGKWHLTGGAVFPGHPEFACGITDMIFTATTHTTIVNSTASSYAVTYIFGADPPVTEYVIDANGGHLTYNFHGRDEIVLDTGQLCTYRRVG